MRHLIWAMIMGGLIVLMTAEAPLWVDGLAWSSVSCGVFLVAGKLWPRKVAN